VGRRGEDGEEGGALPRTPLGEMISPRPPRLGKEGKSSDADFRVCRLKGKMDPEGCAGVLR